MEDPNDEEWRIDKSTGRLRQVWNTGLTLGKRIALTGIVVSAAPLTLPPLVVLSAFGVAFSLPSGFYIASYAATDKIMRALLTMPNNPDPPPLLIQYEDREQEKAYMYNDDKVKEEGYEEDCDLEEGEMELEGDTSLPFKMRIDLDEENDKIQVDSEFAVDVSSRLEIDEAVKDVGGVIVEKFEQDGYEADVGEYTEKEETIPSIASETPSMEEGRGEVVGENDIDVDQVEVVDVFVPQVSMEDSRCMVKFGDVELQELEKDTTGMIESIRDKLEHSVEKEEQSLTIASEILKGIGEAEEISFLEEEVVVSADLGGENDVDVKRVEDVNVHGPRVSMEHSSLQVNFGDVELKEIERETIGTKPNREKSTSETRYHELSMEKEEQTPSIASEILKGIKEAEKEMSLIEEEGEEEILRNGLEAVVVSAEVCGKDDTDVGKVEEVGIFEPQVSMEDSMPKVKYGDVEPEELERETTNTLAVMFAETGGENNIYSEPKMKFGDVEPDELEKETTGMIESLRDEGISQSKTHDEHLVEKKEPIRNAASDIPEGIKQAEEDISLMDKLQIGAVVAVMSAEVGGENDIYNEQMKGQERDKDVSEATSHELLRETEESIPSIASETLIGIEEAEEEIPLLVEEAVFSADAVGENDINVEQVEDFLPGVSMEDNSPEVKFGYVELEELEREMKPMNESISDEGTSETKKQVYREELGIVDDLEPLIVPSEEESVDTIAVLQEHSIIVSTTQDYRREDAAISAKEEIQMEGEEGKTRVRRLVVHVNKCCDSNIGRAMGETRSLILKRVDRHPEGIYRSSDDIQDSTSTKLMEAGLWKQMNAMRTIVGYESPPHASCVEELKALYVFTGVEPPASLKEPLNIADVNEKLMFLMAVVGVKE